MAFDIPGTPTTPVTSTAGPNVGTYTEPSNLTFSNQPALYQGIYFPVVGGQLPSASTYGAARPNDRYHKGTDLFAARGSSVVAAVAGTITKVVYEDSGLGGYRVTVRDNNGNYHYYAHLDPKSANLNLQVNTTVKAGQLIGYVGNTGNASTTSPHLHYSINEGRDDLMPVDAWQFLSSGQVMQAPTVGTGSQITGEGPLSDSRVPAGMEIFKVDSKYFWVGAVDGGGGAAAWLYFGSDQVPAGTKVTSISASQWQDKVLRSQMINGGSAIELNGFAGKDWKEIVDQFLFESGLYGSDALKDQGVMNAIAAYIGAGDMSEEEFATRLRDSDWWRTHTDKQREWNDKSPAEQDQALVDEVSKLAGLWFTYVGEDINLQAYDKNRDGKVTGAEIKAGNPTLYKFAKNIASGVSTQNEVINTWVKDTARQNPESPWSRSVREEEIKQGEFDVNVDSWAGEVMKLYDQWGLPMSYKNALVYGKQLAMNAQSFTDIQEAVKDQALGLYPTKPREVDTTSWAQPYMQTFENLLETPPPGLFDPTIQKALTTGVGLGDYRKILKQDERWMNTKNAKDEHYNTLSELGKVMGF